MSLRERISPFIAGRLLDTRRQDKARAGFEAARVRSSAPHTITYFHRPDDPYAVLACQMLAGLVERFDIELQVMLVPLPDDRDAPERDALAAYARRDATAIAPHYGLTFAPADEQPDPKLARRALAIGLGAIKQGVFADVGPQIDSALWQNSATALNNLAGRVGEAGVDEVKAATADGHAQRAAMGHYLGGTFCYGGEQYWAVDRLHYLETRLAELGAYRGSAPFTPATQPPALCDTPSPGGEGPGLDFYLSLRSPYTAVGAARFFELADHYNCKVNLRFVLPMMMRGIPASREKQRYIIRDAKREADRLGVPFGHIADPFGRPSERGLSLIPYAVSEGRGREYVLSFLSGVWAEAIPAGSTSGLKKIVTRAGLDWQVARRWLEDQAWRDEAERNREALFALGLWGVPTVAVGDIAYWGQDRLWLIEREIQKILGQAR